MRVIPKALISLFSALAALVAGGPPRRQVQGMDPREEGDTLEKGGEHARAATCRKLKRKVAAVSFRRTQEQKVMRRSPKSKILDKILADTGEKCSAKIGAVSSPIFVLACQGRNGRKTFHGKSSKKFTRRDPKFFHCETLGVGGPKEGGDLIVFGAVSTQGCRFAPPYCPKPFDSRHLVMILE